MGPKDDVWHEASTKWTCSSCDILASCAAARATTSSTTGLSATRPRSSIVNSTAPVRLCIRLVSFLFSSYPSTLSTEALPFPHIGKPCGLYMWGDPVSFMGVRKTRLSFFLAAFGGLHWICWSGCITPRAGRWPTFLWVFPVAEKRRRRDFRNGCPDVLQSVFV